MNREDIALLIERERAHVGGLPVRTDKVYTSQEWLIKKNYSRAYEYWSDAKYLILERVYLQSRNVNVVAILLQRQPHIVREKLEEKRLLE
ncbi:hypothetical protein ACQ86N_01285 [Puia sp. P3]|uniref:hypothetical protein n=1 Tax=Puia sp. P3 TaxID=3423952 RepID=UPI003D67862B